MDNDDAIDVINQLIAVADALIELGDDTEDWVRRKAWLNSLLNELWTARGPYPGFPSVLECLGLNALVSHYIALPSDAAMKEYRASVREFLNGGIDSMPGADIPPAESRRIRREYQLLGEETAQFLFDTLSRFDIRANQMRAILAESREDVSISASVAQMQEDPYIIFEQYVGLDPDDTIPFYKIDNGVIPSPEYGIGELLDVGATERLRAFCVDELRRIAAHSFGRAETILQAVNARLARLPEWKQYSFRMQNFSIDRNILDGALVRKKDENGTLYLYLREVYEDERKVEQTLRTLAERPDIQPGLAISPERFKSGLREPHSQLEEKAPNRYEEILDHQAATCMQIFTKPLCVISGAAGTGKTTVIRTILDNIERIDRFRASFLLMAPTGKAAERIKTQTGKPSSTIHSYLAKNGWINNNFTLKRRGGKSGQGVNTIIIDECSMIDLNLFATLLRSINWNSVQRLILIGDPNQLPPIGRGRVFADTIEWLNAEYPENVGTLTDNIRQLVNKVEGNGRGILDLAEVFLQDRRQTDDADRAAQMKSRKEELGVFDRQKPKQQPLSPEMREACRKLDVYAKRIRLLAQYGLQTLPDVEAFIQVTGEKASELSALREKVRNHLRRCSDPDKRQTLVDRRDKLTTQIGVLRDQNRTARDILAESGEVKRQLHVERDLRHGRTPEQECNGRNDDRRRGFVR